VVPLVVVDPAIDAGIWIQLILKVPQVPWLVVKLAGSRSQVFTFSANVTLPAFTDDPGETGKEPLREARSG